MYSTQKVLEFACAAYRTYGGYIKESEFKYDDKGQFLFVKHSNKELVKYALGIRTYGNSEQEFRPISIILEAEDISEAEEVKKYFRRLMFSVVAGQNEFETEVNSLLENEEVPENKVGYIVCLPHVYRRDKQKNDIAKAIKNCENSLLASEGAAVFDKDCEVLKVSRSKNFDAWNVLAIVDNKVVSWMSKREVFVGPAVIQKANVKGQSINYQTGKTETRLNYVKVSQ